MSNPLDGSKKAFTSETRRSCLRELSRNFPDFRAFLVIQVSESNETFDVDN
jgi:hypothetical protein